MSRSEIDNLKSRFAEGVQSKLRSGGERQSGRYSDTHDFESPKVKVPTKPKSASGSERKRVRNATSPPRATSPRRAVSPRRALSPRRAVSPRRALSPRRATSPKPRPASQKKKVASTPVSKSIANRSDSVKTFKTPKSATKNVPSTSTPKSNKGVQQQQQQQLKQIKKRKADGKEDDEETGDSGSKKVKRETESDSKTPKRRSLRKKVSFRGDEMDVDLIDKPSNDNDELEKSGSWWFCRIM